MGAMEPTAKPMEEAVKDSRQVMPMKRANLHIGQIPSNKPTPPSGPGSSKHSQTEDFNVGQCRAKSICYIFSKRQP